VNSDANVGTLDTAAAVLGAAGAVWVAVRN
jgi:hypothetical protein